MRYRPVDLTTASVFIYALDSPLVPATSKADKDTWKVVEHWRQTVQFWHDFDTIAGRY